MCASEANRDCYVWLSPDLGGVAPNSCMAIRLSQFASQQVLTLCFSKLAARKAICLSWRVIAEPCLQPKLPTVIHESRARVQQVLTEAIASMAPLQDLEIEVWETWSKEAGRFVYDYTVDEDCYIDKGKVVLTVAGELVAGMSF